MILEGGGGHIHIHYLSKMTWRIDRRADPPVNHRRVCRNEKNTLHLIPIQTKSEGSNENHRINTVCLKIIQIKNIQFCVSGMIIYVTPILTENTYC